MITYYQPQAQKKYNSYNILHQIWKKNRIEMKEELNVLMKNRGNKGFEGFEGLLILLSAERVGVEPTVQFNPYDDLANRSFRPLRHLSLIQFI